MSLQINRIELFQMFPAKKKKKKNKKEKTVSAAAGPRTATLDSSVATDENSLENGSETKPPLPHFWIWNRKSNI